METSSEGKCSGGALRGYEVGSVRRREFLVARSDPATVSDEVAREEYRHIQAIWLVDHVDVLEEAGEITSEQAAEIRQITRGP